MIRHGKKVPNDICLKDIELHAPKMITIMSLIINIIWGRGGGNLYNHSMSMEIFTLIMNKIFKPNPKYETNGYGLE